MKFSWNFENKIYEKIVEHFGDSSEIAKIEKNMYNHFNTLTTTPKNVSGAKLRREKSWADFSET